MATQAIPFAEEPMIPSTEADNVVVHFSLPGAKGQALYGEAKNFSTGSTGFFVGGRVQGANGKRYQVSCNLVLIGSKPKAD